LSLLVLFNVPNVRAADPFPGNPSDHPLLGSGLGLGDMTNTQTSTTQLAQNYLSRNIPVCAVMVDSPWETYFNTFVPDSKSLRHLFGDDHRAPRTGRSGHLRATAWINTDSPDYTTVKTNNYIVNPNSRERNVVEGQPASISIILTRRPRPGQYKDGQRAQHGP